MKNKLKTLAKLSKTISKSSRLPIWINGRKATATNNNTELTLNLNINWNGSEPENGIYIDADELLKVVNNSEFIENLDIVVKNKNSFAYINGIGVNLSTKQFEHINAENDDTCELYLSDELRNAVNDVRDCVCDDEYRMALHGVFITRNIVAATDAHILSVRNIETSIPENRDALIYPEMFDYIPEGCDVIKAGNEFNLAVSEFGKIISKRPSGIYPNVMEVFPKGEKGKVELHGDSLKNSIKRALKRKLDYAVLVVKKDAAGMFFFENLISEGDTMGLSLPSEVNTGSADVMITFRVKLLNKLISKIKGDVKISYQDSTRAAVINEENLIMPLMNENFKCDFVPEKIDITRNSNSKKNECSELQKQRVVELPDGKFIVVGGKKPKGGKIVKAWIVDNFEI